MKKLLSLLTALALMVSLGLSALAVEAAPPAWALNGLVEAEALGLWSAEDNDALLESIEEEQLTAILDAVAAKLALLELTVREEEQAPLLLDGTRGAVVTALYREAMRYDFPDANTGSEAGAVGFFTNLGILRGDENGDLHLDRPCTVLEAVTLAERLVLAVYDLNDAGSRGLLWKATNGGNTLYLFGTAHLDRNNLYPFHKTVRDALMFADAAYFELDLNDQTGLDELAAVQMYSDGTTLKDHVSAEVYDKTMSVLIPAGLDEETYAAMEAQMAIFKPWALALALQNLMMMDETTGDAILATDSYLTNKAYANGIPVGGVESYALQIAIFDTLSAEYQEEMLGAMLSLPTGEVPEETGTVGDVVDAFFLPWQQGDLAGFEAAYGKAHIVTSDDELSARLYTDRDPGMIEAAVALLESEGENVFFLALGAGHMIDPGGVVGALQELGYTVELVR